MLGVARGRPPLDHLTVSALSVKLDREEMGYYSPEEGIHSIERDPTVSSSSLLLF